MKILSLFLVSLFFASSFQFSPEYIRESRIRDERALDLANALIGVVDQLIQTVSGALNNFLTTVGNLVLSGINNIESALRQAVDDFVVKLLEAKDEIENLIGDDIIGCFGNLEENFQSIKNNTVEGISTCYESGKESLTSISIDILNYGITNEEIISSVKTKIQSCLEMPSFGEKLTCVVESASVMRNALFNLLKNIDDTAKTITSTIEDSVIGTYGCINTAVEEGNQNISDILELTKDCIALASTTIAPVTTTTEEPPVNPETTEELPINPETTEEIPVNPETTEEIPVNPETTEELPVNPETTEELPVNPETTEELPVNPETTEELPVNPETTEEIPVNPETTEELPVNPETTEEPAVAPESRTE